MILHVREARYLEDYKVDVLFDDGRRGVADLQDAVKGQVFESLLDPGKFAAFRVDEDLETLVWKNGADLAPEYIYFQAFKSEERLYPRFREWGYLG